MVVLLQGLLKKKNRAVLAVKKLNHFVKSWKVGTDVTLVLKQHINLWLLGLSVSFTNVFVTDLHQTNIFFSFKLQTALL